MARPQSPVVKATRARRPTKKVRGDTGDAVPPVDASLAYTIPEVAGVLKCSERKVAQLIADGRLTAFYVGDLCRVSRAALDRFMAIGGAPRVKANAS